ncbi:leucine-rich repeat domain-containing protein [Haloimpatiens sp. FM7330]|uniref:leucine-rich repeat domain-containing protein n=1 Tax=Haloimpatiens sp. FM7330 TaxID=3298610 RepID=UPI00362A61A2
MGDITDFRENIDILIDENNPKIQPPFKSINSSLDKYITTDPSYFQFELNHNQSSYMISAKDKTNIPSMVILPKEYNGLPVTKIKNNGFSGCTNLFIVIFEDKSNIKKIGLFAFYGCTQLESIELPQSIKSIKPGAFHSCSKLQQVYLHSKYPPQLGKVVFCQTSPTLDFYVPSKSKELYKVFDGWKDYKKCIFSLPCNIPSNLGFFNFILNDDDTYTVYVKDKKILPNHW